LRLIARQIRGNTAFRSLVACHAAGCTSKAGCTNIAGCMHTNTGPMEPVVVWDITGRCHAHETTQYCKPLHATSQQRGGWALYRHCECVSATTLTFDVLQQHRPQRGLVGGFFLVETGKHDGCDVLRGTQTNNRFAEYNNWTGTNRKCDTVNTTARLLLRQIVSAATPAVTTLLLLLPQ
jgi:hypothetical protein